MAVRETKLYGNERMEPSFHFQLFSRSSQEQLLRLSENRTRNWLLSTTRIVIKGTQGPKNEFVWFIGLTRQFKEISFAYSVLSDESKRSLYDRHGEAGLKVKNCVINLRRRKVAEAALTIFGARISTTCYSSTLGWTRRSGRRTLFLISMFVVTFH